MNKKIIKQAAGLYGPNLHSSETDAVLEYFPSNISPSLPLSVSLPDLLFMPMVTLEALWIPGECEISLAGQQPAQQQTLASSCGTGHHFLLAAQRGSAARVHKFGQGSAKSLDGKRDTDSSGQRSLLRLLDQSIKV